MNYFDDNEDDIIYGRFRGLKQAVSCYRCDKDGLYFEGGVLMDDAGAHQCSLEDLHDIVLDEFE